jgi:hypothetical protein
MIMFDELTLGEIEEIELLVGRSIDETFADGKPKGRALRAVYFVAKRKEQPGLKFEDTEKISQAEAVAYLTGDESKKEF